jgi:predicted site-specific integrase-resolvase
MTKEYENMERGKEVKAVLYARVSSEEQVAGNSIDAQRRVFRQRCASKHRTPLR